MNRADEQRRKVTIEDLLHLKRAERPEQDYWVKFEGEMRQKQLAALLRKDPWWTRLAHNLGRKHYLQLGASAALVAMVLLNVREQNVTLPESSRPMPSLAGVVGAPGNSQESIIASDPVAEPDQVEEVLATTEVPVASISDTKASTATAANEQVDKIATQMHRSLAAEIAELGQMEAGVNPVDLMRHGRMATVARTESVRQQPELGSVSISSNRKSVRLLAGYEDRRFVPEPNAPDIVRERLARRLSDQDLADQVRRLDVKGDRLSLRL